jgi:uncharacterized protein YbjQ (UPF0145 family)
MRHRALIAIVSTLFGLGVGCVHHARPVGYSTASAPRVAAHDDGDDDHDHAPEGPVTPELLAAADRVLILQSGADRASEVLGLIDEHGTMGHEDEALARLRRDAARMGGDAVVHVEFHHAGEHHDDGDGDADHAEAESTSFSGEHEADPDADHAVDEDSSDPMALHLSGTVVRFRDLVSGRPYDVLGRIVVHVPMTREEDGLTELRRRAREMHADLLLHVEFHHGHGSEPLEVDGTAIRFR